MRLALDGARVPAADDRQCVDIRAGEIREGLCLEVAPHVLDGIQFGGVGREVEGARAEASEELADVRRAVCIGAVPDEHHPRAQLPIQLLGEGEDRLGIEVLLDEKLKIQPDRSAVRADAQGGDHRDLPAMPADVPEHWGLSAGPPRAPHHGQKEQAAFVNEDQPRAQAVGFFLMRGQSCLIQRRIPSSSRSHARRTGRCGVQPSERSKRPM